MGASPICSCRRYNRSAVAPTCLDDGGVSPSPDQLVADFEKVDFSSQLYAETMLRTGRDPKSDAEKVFRSRYTADLLCEAAKAMECLAEPEAGFLGILRRMPLLTESIVYGWDRWNAEIVPDYQAALDSLAAQPESPEADYLREMLLKVKDLFWLEVQNPKQDFYMCVLDEMLNRYSKGEREAATVPQEALYMMHCIDMPVHQRKSDARRDVAAAFFARMYESGLAGHQEWELQAVVDQHGGKEEQRAVSSVTPLLSFRLSVKDPALDGYVLMEGNGRLAALNAALDVVRENHPDFVAPRIAITVVPFHGPLVARKNIGFFLDLTWRCAFPDVELAGWRPQICNSARPISAEVVRWCPRYYGYAPIQELRGQPPPARAGAGQLQPTCCRAPVAGGLAGA
uniref:Uncharacterized protein n=1 Tax=Alexandrium monilatum TaxID=311494 RepID=A0A7S4PZ87_9DINO